MGHGKDVHLGIYRNNPLVSEVSEMAPILNDAQGRKSKQTDRNKIENAEPLNSDSGEDSKFESDSDSDSNLDSDSSKDDFEEVNTQMVKVRSIGSNFKRVSLMRC